MGRDKWDHIHNRNLLGNIREKIEGGTAADKTCEQLEAATGLKVLCFRTLRGLGRSAAPTCLPDAGRYSRGLSDRAQGL